MGETKLDVDVESSLDDNGITSSTDARYHDSDNNPKLKRLASYGCSTISDYLVEIHAETIRRSMEEIMQNFQSLPKLNLTFNLKL